MTAELAPATPSPYAVYLSSQAPSSATAQHSSLRSLLRDWGAVPPDPHAHPWHRWTPAHLSAARAWLIAHRGPATAARLYSAIRRILRECYRASLIDRDRWEKLDMCAPPPRPAQSIERAPSSAEVRAMFEIASAQPLALGARNAALLALAYGCGLRRGELCQVEIPDDWACPPVLRVNGKGKKPRLVPVPAGARLAIDDYLSIRRDLMDGNWRASRALLLATTPGGRSFLSALAYASVDRAIEALCSAARLPRYSSHDLRRAYCTALLAAGADLSKVQRLMGHASMTTTAIYDHRGDAELFAAGELVIVPYAVRGDEWLSPTQGAADPPSSLPASASSAPSSSSGPPCYAGAPILSRWQ